MKVGSLFSGIGGIDLGLKWAGMETIWFVENDDYCQKVLAKHWPGVPCYGDIKTVDFRSLPRPDLLCGGFPCQPFSTAGKRQGKDDDRYLWPEFYRVICQTKPKWILVENVPGILSIDLGRIFGEILRDLAESGYDAEWQVLSAAQFGAQHKRERVFLLAYPNGIRSFQGGVFQRINNKKYNKWPPITINGFINSCGYSLPRLAFDLGDNKRISFELDRLRCLGNAVVPQVAEWIGKQIMAYEVKG